MPDFIESIPDILQFRKDILPIYPEGDLESAHNLLTELLENGYEKTVDGQSLTWTYILTKFKQLHEQWYFNFGTKDTKYLKDKDREKRLDIYDFITRKYWNREFPIKRGNAERDKYLFGSLPIDNLKVQLQNFRDGQKKA